ncbi:MAG: hypothetical protein Q7J82_09200 [Coriobacteriia bacterium]|nr:hypothetical protein [Coriobacteriia bacterium]
MSWIRRVLGISPEPESPAPHAVDVRVRYADALMASAEVVSVGLGQDANDNPVIVVGVTKASEQTAALPRSLEGVPVVVKTVGTFTAQE